MITEGQRSGRRSRGQVAWTLALAMVSALATGCVASASDLEKLDSEDEATAPVDDGAKTTRSTDDDESPAVRPASKVVERTTSHAAAEGVSVAGPAASPTASPQPSPWRPGGPAALSEPSGTAGEDTTLSNESSPGATPQPSPWEGHVPPPSWPNTVPAQETAAQ